MPYKKPSRVRYYGVAAYADGQQLDRVQAIGTTARLNTDDIRELGNLNIVELVDDVPQVDVSIDANDFGSLQTVASLSGLGWGGQVLAVPSGTVGQTPYSQITAGTNQVKVWPGAYIVNGIRVPIPSQTLAVPSAGNWVVYLPAVTNATPATGPVATIAASGSVPAGATPLATLAVPSGSANTITQAMITDVRPWNTFTLNNFEFSKCDIFVPIKQPTSTATERTMYMENVFVNRVDMSWQTRGISTITYGAETDNKRWFVNAGASVYQDLFFPATAQTTFNLTYAPVTLNNGNKTLKVEYGTGGLSRVLVEGADFTVTGTTLTLTGISPSSGDILRVRYACAGISGNIFNPVTSDMHPFPAGGLRHGQVEIYLSDDNNNPVLRVQNARLSIPLQRTPLMQLGNFLAYDRPLELPIQVTASIDVLDSDLDVFARMAGATYSTTAGLTGTNEIALHDLLWNKNLIIKVYRENDLRRAKLPAGHPFKFPSITIQVNSIYPTSDRWEVRTGADATQTLDFRSYSLTMISGIGG